MLAAGRWARGVGARDAEGTHPASVLDTEAGSSLLSSSLVDPKRAAVITAIAAANGQRVVATAGMSVPFFRGLACIRLTLRAPATSAVGQHSIQVGASASPSRP